MPQVAPNRKADHLGDASGGTPTPWVTLLDSIQRRRWPGALYYKPACLLAVIDGIEDGSLDPSNLNPQVVLARFQALVLKIAPERAELGWRPFWHLGNDGAWGFFQGVRRVVPEDYGKERKPNSRGELLNRIDRVSVEPGLQAAWESPHTRAILRQGLITMLKKDGDSTCSMLADMCSVAGKMASTRVDASIESESRGGQGFLESAEARRAVELRAMEVASTYFRNEGYIVDDVSLRMPYDLQCTRADQALFVEVKGTTSDGSAVLLTAGEVRFASTHANQMVLAVVSGVALEAAAETSWIAGGGVLRLFWRWKPEADDLSALSYSCRIPLHSGQEPGESARNPARNSGMDASEVSIPSFIQEL